VALGAELTGAGILGPTVLGAGPVGRWACGDTVDAATVLGAGPVVRGRASPRGNLALLTLVGGLWNKGRAVLLPCLAAKMWDAL